MGPSSRHSDWSDRIGARGGDVMTFVTNRSAASLVDETLEMWWSATTGDQPLLLIGQILRQER
ncbi:hypothetical protein B0675_34475 [Streptomyces sp. M41(2017)]|nr:hypothetical protein B0675_34475 [Streptomyces sp. M41(2017)]